MSNHLTMWEKYRWFYTSFDQILYSCKQGCIFYGKMVVLLILKYCVYLKWLLSHLKIINSSSKFSVTIPAFNCDNQNSQDWTLQTGSFLNGKECIFRETRDVILHQQLNGFDFPSYILKQNSDMNSKITFASCQTHALHLSPGGKAKRDPGLQRSQTMGCTIPSIFYAYFWLGQTEKYYNFSKCWYKMAFSIQWYPKVDP